MGNFTPIGQVKAGGGTPAPQAAPPKFAPTSTRFTPISTVRAGAILPQTPAPAPAPKKGGGGLLHDIFHNPATHVLGQTVTDLKNVAVNAPAGIYAVGKALGKEAEYQTTFGHVGSKKDSPLLDLAKQTVTQTKQDLSHPLRHPGYTALDLLGLAGGVGAVAGKGAELANAAKAGESAGQLATRLVTKTVPAERTIRAGGITAKIGNYSQNPAVRQAQRYIDALREKFPEKSPPLVKNQYERVGKALAQQREFEQKMSNAPFTQLRVAGRKVKWDSPQGVAMRAAAEGTTLDERIAAHAKALGEATTATARRNIQRQIRLAQQARKFMSADGKITDPKLAALYQKTKDAALLEDQRLVGAKLMDPQGAKAAIEKPAALIAGKEGSGEFHVGYERRGKPNAINKPAGIGSTNTIGIPRKPGRLTHSLTGANFREGAFRNDVPSLVADNAIESERYLATERARQFFLQHAQDTPEGIPPGKAVAIRTDALGHGSMPNEVRDFLDQQRQLRQSSDHTFNPLGMMYEDYRQRVFPNVDPTDFEQYAGQVKWINKDLLGGLNKPGPLASLMQHESAAKGLRAADAINNAQKFAILYLKPAYAVPNMVGNAFLNLVQQGFAAPANLTRSARLAAKIGPEDTAVIRDLMGEGIGSSLEARTGIASRLTNAAATKVFEPLVDTPFRLASFLYEARRELGLHGAMNSADWQKVHTLLHDESMRGRLQNVVHRANAAIIDYGDLNPVEQAIIRRVLFFYPWLKGSTRYAGHFALEHPVAAGVLGQVGQHGQQVSQQGLGQLPSWAEGYFRVGGSDYQPLVVNPTSAGILNQPGQIAETLNEFLSSPNPRSAYTLGSFLTPALGAANTTLSGKDQFSGRNVPQNANTFLSQILGFDPSHPLRNASLPLLLLAERLRASQQGKTFPLTKEQALLQFLLGSAAPKTANRGKLNQAAVNERKPLKP